MLYISIVSTVMLSGHVAVASAASSYRQNKNKGWPRPLCARAALRLAGLQRRDFDD